ncbi:MAG: hypothetical protein MZW92_05745 [Comamonadaceae bacterium]|nr:hypothetical protein [Comamonadaceae bacterium]
MTARPSPASRSGTPAQLALACAIAAGVAAGALVREPSGWRRVALSCSACWRRPMRRSLCYWRGAARPGRPRQRLRLLAGRSLQYLIVTGFALVWQGLDANNMAAAALLGASAWMMPSALAAHRLPLGNDDALALGPASLPLVYGAGVPGGRTMQEQRTQQALAMSHNDQPPAPPWRRS